MDTRLAGVVTCTRIAGLSAAARRAVRPTLALVAMLAAAPAAAQLLPEGPLRSPDGKLTVTGEISASIGAADDIAFFNYTDYERNTLRLFRASLAGQWRPLSRLALVADVRSEDLHHPDLYAAYVRVRPIASIPLDVQAGRIPLAFGAFPRSSYNTDNFLIGYPLAYQYLTSLRADSLPSRADDVLIMRGRGWLSNFPVGNSQPAAGLPLITAFQWDTGVQVRWAARGVELAGAVTAGTLAQPRVRDNNDGRQLIARASVRPMVGLRLGASSARGEWIASSARRALPAETAARDYYQTAFGTDAEYSRDHWVVRGEVVWSRWDMPFPGDATARRLDARAAWVEGRYRLTPRIFAAARFDTLNFSRIAGTLFGGRPTTWDAAVDRVEVGAGYYFQRNLIGRFVVQRNDRDGGRVRERVFASGQLSYWF